MATKKKEHGTDPLRLAAPEDPSGLKYGSEVYIKVLVSRVQASDDGKAETIVVVNLPTPSAFASTGAATTAVVPVSEILTTLPDETEAD